MQTQDLLTADAVADRLAVKPATVRDWSRRGIIPRVVLSPKVIRFDYAEVVHALRERGQERKAANRGE